MTPKIYGLMVKQRVMPGVSASAMFHFAAPDVQEQFITYVETNTDLAIAGVFEYPVCETFNQSIDRLNEVFKEYRR